MTLLSHVASQQKWPKGGSRMAVSCALVRNVAASQGLRKAAVNPGFLGPKKSQVNN
jgi:hypothetical protein